MSVLAFQHRGASVTGNTFIHWLTPREENNIYYHHRRRALASSHTTKMPIRFCETCLPCFSTGANASQESLTVYSSCHPLQLKSNQLLRRWSLARWLNRTTSQLERGSPWPPQRSTLGLDNQHSSAQWKTYKEQKHQLSFPVSNMLILSLLQYSWISFNWFAHHYWSCYLHFHRSPTFSTRRWRSVFNQSARYWSVSRVHNELHFSALSRIIIITASLKYDWGGDAAMQTHSLHANPQNFRFKWRHKPETWCSRQGKGLMLLEKLYYTYRLKLQKKVREDKYMSNVYCLWPQSGFMVSQLTHHVVVDGGQFEFASQMNLNKADFCIKKILLISLNK